MASAPQPQDGLHAVGQAEVDQQKKHRREGHHDEHHDGGHRGLLPARPGHLLDLADHLTHVLGRVYCRHWVELLPTTPKPRRSEEHTSELQSLMRISYAVFCLKKKTQINKKTMMTSLAQTDKTERLVEQ